MHPPQQMVLEVGSPPEQSYNIERGNFLFQGQFQEMDLALNNWPFNSLPATERMGTLLLREGEDNGKLN